MKIVIFGLSISSSWGNGHATLWRGLCGALGRHGHTVVFFEKDVQYYAEHRDLTNLRSGRLVLYERWAEVRSQARREASEADVAIVTSFCPDAVVATELLMDTSGPLRVFYDLDSPVTLASVASHEPVAYLGPRGLQDFDLVLSYAGGDALEQLKSRLKARLVAPLYGSVDPTVHHPAAPSARYSCTLSYLGTHSSDRVEALRKLFVEPARQLANERFVIGGSQYDGQFPWLPNIYYMSHVPSSEHPTFFCSGRFTLNVTRAAMASNGYCPSGRMFEAAACGALILTDPWLGLDQFFEPGQEVQVVRNTGDVLNALSQTPSEIRAMGEAARERVLACHTADLRATELERILEGAAQPIAGGV